MLGRTVPARFLNFLREVHDDEATRLHERRELLFMVVHLSPINLTLAKLALVESGMAARAVHPILFDGLLLEVEIEGAASLTHRHRIVSVLIQVFWLRLLLLRVFDGVDAAGH